jgi:hypothetical protein
MLLRGLTFLVKDAIMSSGLRYVNICLEFKRLMINRECIGKVKKTDVTRHSRARTIALDNTYGPNILLMGIMMMCRRTIE